jgi:hypothetical protein
MVEASLSTFTRVACESSGCVAVGEIGSYYDFDSYWLPLAVTWSGGVWSGAVTEPIPLAGSPHTEAAELNAVSCAVATQCVAVGQGGEYNSGDGPVPTAPYSTMITPASAATTPGPVTSVVVTPYLGGVDVSWTPPTDDGNAPITSYTAWISGTEGNLEISCTVTATSCALPDLVNGQQDKVAVTDNNGLDTSVPAFSTSFIPGAVPSEPHHIRAYGSTQRLTVTWDAASSPPGEAVLRYQVTATHGAQTLTCMAKARACTMREPGKGRWFRISVSAYDASGWSRAVVVIVPR